MPVLKDLAITQDGKPLVHEVVLSEEDLGGAPVSLIEVTLEKPLKPNAKLSDHSHDLRCPAPGERERHVCARRDGSAVHRPGAWLIRAGRFAQVGDELPRPGLSARFEPAEGSWRMRTGALGLRRSDAHRPQRRGLRRHQAVRRDGRQVPPAAARVAVLRVRAIGHGPFAARHARSPGRYDERRRDAQAALFPKGCRLGTEAVRRREGRLAEARSVVRLPLSAGHRHDAPIASHRDHRRGRHRLRLDRRSPARDRYRHRRARDCPRTRPPVGLSADHG